MAITPDRVFSSPSRVATRTVAVGATNVEDYDSDIPELSAEARELLSTEEFVLPIAIGDFLPNRGQLFREWEEARNKELGSRRRIHILDDNYDSDSDEPPYSSSLFSSKNTSKETSPNNIGDANKNQDNSKTSSTNNSPADPKRAEELTTEIDAYLDKLKSDSLKTEETFPSEYMVDSANEENPEDPSSSETTNQIRSKCRRPRKSVVFSPKPTSRGSETEAGGADLRSVPSVGASGIVGVMGRKVHIDRLVGSDGDDNPACSLYSLLRAWVQDDPERKPAREPPPVVSHRKPLLDYISKKASDGGSHNGDLDESNNRTEVETLDVLGWLSEDPHQRALTIPFYPTQEKMRELHKRSEAKRKAKAARKKRLAAAKENLRSRGIRI